MRPPSFVVSQNFNNFLKKYFSGRFTGETGLYAEEIRNHHSPQNKTQSGAVSLTTYPKHTVTLIFPACIVLSLSSTLSMETYPVGYMTIDYGVQNPATNTVKQYHAKLGMGCDLHSSSGCVYCIIVVVRDDIH